MDYLMSGRRGRSYTELFDQAMADGPFTDLHVAVAYATIGGVKLLEQTLMEGLGEGWHKIRKRWLAGIDWCRSDPWALERLGALERSEVRVPDGETVVTSRGCTPGRTFHPKIFVFSRVGRTAIVCGSGNLSTNGLSHGCEAGGVITFETAADEPRATPGDGLLKRTFKHFWIDAGALGANLGAGMPGNQLDMKRFTRAFFGAPIRDLPPQTEIDRVALVWDGVSYEDRTLKYGDNHMDKLNVPPAGDRGKNFYRGKTLLFSRRRGGAYDFQAGSPTDRRSWKRASERSGVAYPLSGSREWGLF